MKSANLQNHRLLTLLNQAGIEASYTEAEALRRAQMTLYRWAELECGDGDNFRSWSIERDEATGKPFMCVYPHDGKMHRSPIADREAGALRRVAAICESLGCHFYHQTDPRGCALYVSLQPLTDSDYNRGVACVVE